MLEGFTARAAAVERGAKTSGAARRGKVDGGGRKNEGEPGSETRSLLAILPPLNDAFNLREDLQRAASVIETTSPLSAVADLSQQGSPR